MRRHLAAVMFTDVVGYSSTVRQDEEAGRRVRHRHRSTVEAALENHGGTLLQYFGDGSLSVFQSAVEAVAAARKIQADFRSDPEGALRIGIDLGDIAYDEQGAYGDAVNVASRLESLSEPGGILISWKVHNELVNHPEFETVPLGEVPLKSLGAAVPVYALSVEEMGPSPGQTGASLPSPGDRSRAEPRTVDSVAAALWDRIRRPLARTPAHPLDGSPTFGPLPLVARNDEMAGLHTLARMVEDGTGRTIILTGDRGAGKTRLAVQLLEELAERGWLTTHGQAFLTEAGVPFAPFADAFGPLLREVRPSELQLLAQGGAQDLSALWPPLARGEHGERSRAEDASEPRSRLFWTFSQLLGTLTSARPLLILLEDLQWADESSLDLLQFVARQIADKRVLLLCIYCETEVEAGGHLEEISEALERTRLAQRTRLSSLSREGTEELITRIFEVSPSVIKRFSQRLYDWTRGNPFFLEGTLRSLVETGQLYRRQGQWLGWEVQELVLPATIRDAISMRVRRLSVEARKLADLAAVMGSHVGHEVLKAVHREPEETLDASLGELTRRGILREGEADGEIVYRFSHPRVAETLRAQIPLAVSRRLHARVAQSLEAHFGAEAGDHVDELAYHFSRAHGEAHQERALLYLAAAGRKALERNAHKEAARYLESAIAYHRRLRGEDRDVADPLSNVDLPDLLESLALARVNLGDQDRGIELWMEVLPLLEKRGDGFGVATLYRRIGQAHLSQGRLASALRSFEEGRRAARRAEDRVGEARIWLVEGVSLQQAGRPSDAREAIDQARGIATDLDDLRLLASAKRALLLIHLWNGELETVRKEGLELRALVAEIADPLLMFWSEWTLAAAAGLRGNTRELLRRLKELERIADRVRSPALRLWATELSLEYAYATGSWDVGVGIGEQAAALGRALNERTILPRILVCLSVIYAGRGDTERSEELVEEAWEISGAQGVAEGLEFLNVHTVVPAHIGRVSHAMALGRWDVAIEIARAGLEVADRTGYVIWGIHRLLPLLGEACIQAGRIDEAEKISQRLRACGEDLDHDLARAWAKAGEALVAWKRGDPAKGAGLLSSAAEVLEGIPMVYDAARLRRQMAGRLWEIGEGGQALKELKRVQSIFETMGATGELRKTLLQQQEVVG